MSQLNEATLIFMNDPPQLLYRIGDRYYQSEIFLPVGAPPQDSSVEDIITFYPDTYWRYSQPIFIKLSDGWIIATSSQGRLYMTESRPSRPDLLDNMIVEEVIPFDLPPFMNLNLPPFDEDLLESLQQLVRERRPFRDFDQVVRERTLSQINSIPVTVFYSPSEHELYYGFTSRFYREQGMFIRPLLSLPEDSIRLFTYPAGREWSSQPLLIITENGWVVYTSQEDHLKLEYASSPDLSTLGVVKEIATVEIPDLTQEYQQGKYKFKELPKFNEDMVDLFHILYYERRPFIKLSRIQEMQERRKLFPLTYEAILNKWYFHRNTPFPMQLTPFTQITELISRDRPSGMELDHMLQVWAPPGSSILTVRSKDGKKYFTEGRLEGNQIFPVNN